MYVYIYYRSMYSVAVLYEEYFQFFPIYGFCFFLGYVLEKKYATRTRINYIFTSSNVQRYLFRFCLHFLRRLKSIKNFGHVYRNLFLFFDNSYSYVGNRRAQNHERTAHDNQMDAIYEFS